MGKFLVVAILWITTVSIAAAENREADFLRQGDGYLATGKYQKAAQAFEHAARINPRNAAAHQGVGMSYLKLGANAVMANQELLGQAAAAFNRALDIDPNLAKARYELGITSLALHNRTEAVRQCDLLKNLDSDLAQTLAARISEYKPEQKYKPVGRSDDRQPEKSQRRNGGATGAPAQRPPAPKRFTGTVEMYGADWCPRCREAKRYMTDKGISFVYHNIEQDTAARRAFQDLGGGGIPLIMIGSKKMRGFSPESLEYYLNNQ